MRKKLILVHLLLAAFTVPTLILVGLSGGLYLTGIKGETAKQEIALPIAITLDFSSDTLEQDVQSLFKTLGIEHKYEYLKNRGKLIQTRPTSRTYFEFSRTKDALKLVKHTPSLQKSMIELHKGHGPKAFKVYQQLVAISLLIIVLSGVWVGISNASMRGKTLATSALGLLVFLVLAFT